MVNFEVLSGYELNEITQRFLQLLRENLGNESCDVHPRGNNVYFVHANNVNLPKSTMDVENTNHCCEEFHGYIRERITVIWQDLDKE